MISFERNNMLQLPVCKHPNGIWYVHKIQIWFYVDNFNTDNCQSCGRCLLSLFCFLNHRGSDCGCCRVKQDVPTCLTPRLKITTECNDTGKRLWDYTWFLKRLFVLLHVTTKCHLTFRAITLARGKISQSSKQFPGLIIPFTPSLSQMTVLPEGS